MTENIFTLRAGLLHDASEAYLLDIPSPIKKKLVGYKELEDNIMKLIAEKFQFEYPLSKEVKSVDSELLSVEWSGLVLKHFDFDCWSNVISKNQFLTIFQKLL